MELETYWDEELPGENDDRMALLEADIAESKSILSRLSDDEDLY